MTQQNGVFYGGRRYGETLPPWRFRGGNVGKGCIKPISRGRGWPQHPIGRSFSEAKNGDFQRQELLTQFHVWQQKSTCVPPPDFSCDMVSVICMHRVPSPSDRSSDHDFRPGGAPHSPFLGQGLSTVRLTWATICDPGTACIGRQGSDGVLPGLSPSNRVRGRVWGSLRYLRAAWGVVTVVRESLFLSPGRFVPFPLIGDVVWGISRCMRRNEVDL